MATKKQTTFARAQAHHRLALHRQARIEREQANEADLTAYLLLQQQLADAEQVYRSAAATIRHRQAAHLCEWRDRGEKPAAIAELIGLPLSELNKLIKNASGGRGGPAPSLRTERVTLATDRKPTVPTSQLSEPTAVPAPEPRRS